MVEIWTNITELSIHDLYFDAIKDLYSSIEYISDIKIDNLPYQFLSKGKVVLEIWNENSNLENYKNLNWSKEETKMTKFNKNNDSENDIIR